MNANKISQAWKHFFKLFGKNQTEQAERLGLVQSQISKKCSTKITGNGCENMLVLFTNYLINEVGFDIDIEFCADLFLESLSIDRHVIAYSVGGIVYGPADPEIRDPDGDWSDVIKLLENGGHVELWQNDTAIDVVYDIEKVIDFLRQ